MRFTQMNLLVKYAGENLHCVEQGSLSNSKDLLSIEKCNGK